MTAPAHPPSKPLLQRLYLTIGFTHGYNFWLFLLLAGRLFLFTLFRLPYLDFHGVFCGSSPSRGGSSTDAASPGECWVYLQPGTRYQWGIIVHLATILPAALLACVQFVPLARRRALAFHRASGWVVVVLSVCGAVSSVVIAPRAMNGGVATVSVGVALSTAFLWALARGCVCARRRQIQRHRDWMLRAWAYAGSIITLRILVVASVIAMSLLGGYHSQQPCGKIDFILKGENATMALYPACAPFFSGQDPDLHIKVPVNVFNGDRVQVASAVNVSFGMAGWAAFVIHFIGVELYLYLTSPKRQNPGKESAEVQKAKSVVAKKVD